MDIDKLQDRIYLGLGKCAQRTGLIAEAYRLSGPSDPLDKINRFVRLPVNFSPYAGAASTNGHGQPLWYGIFDASYTRPGDYLVVGRCVFFIAAQDPLLPVLCIRTNRTISISRPNQRTMGDVNSYRGYIAGASLPLIKDFPASVLGEGKSGASMVNLPTDQMLAFWSVLLPAPSGVLLSQGDLITDDLQRNAVIATSELSDMGWRISAKMATT